MLADDLLSTFLAEDSEAQVEEYQSPPSTRALQQLKKTLESSASTKTPSPGHSEKSAPSSGDEQTHSLAPVKPLGDAARTPEPKFNFRRRASSMLSEESGPATVPPAPLYKGESEESLGQPLPKKDLDKMFQKVSEAKAGTNKEQQGKNPGPAAETPEAHMFQFHPT